MITSFGQLPTGKRLSRIRSSPNYREGSFQNVYETPMLAADASYPKMMRKFFFERRPGQEPAQALPTRVEDLKKINRDEPSITWFGHSSYLLSLNGRIILVDPVFSVWASPFQFMGSRQFPFQHSYTLADLPDPDILIITHDHYDHLDYAVIEALAARVPRFVTSLGVGAHLEYWGVEPGRIHELDWWEEFQVPGLNITALPSRHFSGRGFRRNQALWSAFLIQAGGMKVLVGGDSGYDATFRKVGERFGRIDLAILECGQYDPMWPHIHMTPEESVQASLDLNASLMMAVHWGKFKLANHAWTDPIERASARAGELGVRLATPRIGERMRIDAPVNTNFWWR
jgi:L-ascorbate metabolism protein UlaG (beta-lactamase superfamily)